MQSLKSTTESMVRMVPEPEFTKSWHTGLKEFPFKDENQFKAITFDALKEDVIPVTKFNEFVKCHEAEAKLNDPSLYTFHGGVTRMIRDNSLFNIAYSNNKLTGFCDDYIQKAA